MTEEKKCPCEAVIQAQNEIKKHSERLWAGDTKFEVFKLQLDTIVNDTKEIKEDLKALKEKPGKKWENITSKIIDFAVLLILAYIATNLGLQ